MVEIFGGQCETHDACAVLYIWRPDLFEGRKMRVDVETASTFCYGTTCCDIYGRSKNEVNLYVCEKTNVPEFWENVIEAVQIRSAVPDKKTSKGKGKAKAVEKKTVKKVTKKTIRKAPSPKASTKSLVSNGK